MGCVAELDITQAKILCFKEVEHPLVFPNFENAFEWTIPFIGNCINHAVKNLLKFDNNKVSRKIREIMNSKSAFENDLKLMETVKIIDTIMAMESNKEQKKMQIKN